jgi:hypothetical protein
MSRIRLWGGYYLGTGLITVVGTSFATLSTATAVRSGFHSISCLCSQTSPDLRHLVRKRHLPVDHLRGRHRHARRVPGRLRLPPRHLAHLRLPRDRALLRAPVRPPPRLPAARHRDRDSAHRRVAHRRLRHPQLGRRLERLPHPARVRLLRALPERHRAARAPVGLARVHRPGLLELRDHIAHGIVWIALHEEHIHHRWPRGWVHRRRRRRLHRRVEHQERAGNHFPMVRRFSSLYFL